MHTYYTQVYPYWISIIMHGSIGGIVLYEVEDLGQILVAWAARRFNSHYTNLFVV